MKIPILSMIALLLVQQPAPQIVPQETTSVANPGQATLVIGQFTGQALVGREGSASFFAVSSSGSFVAEKRLGGEMCVGLAQGPIRCFPGPTKMGSTNSFSLSAGNYELRTYLRVREGNCGILDPPTAQCNASFSLKSGETLFAQRVQTFPGCTIVFSPSFPPAPTADVTGRVFLSNGMPAANVRVGITDARSARTILSSAVTDNTGRYQIQGVEPHEYFLLAFDSSVLAYFPGVTSQADATVVTVKDNAAMGAFEFTIPAR